MKIGEYQKMYDLETHYWWHQGRRKIIEVLLKKYLTKTDSDVEILDLGCGTGINFEILRKFGKVEGIDCSPEALKFCQRRGITEVRQGDVENLTIPENSYDAVTAFDILEHLKNDEKAIENVYRVLKPGGIFFLLSPAYQFLWSRHDEALHHYRRYVLSDMHRKLNAAGFETIKRSYCISFLFLPIVFYRLITSLWSDGQPKTSYVLLPGWLNGFFVLLLRLEAYILKYFNFPFGVSILCLAKKHD